MAINWIVLFCAFYGAVRFGTDLYERPKRVRVRVRTGPDPKPKRHAHRSSSSSKDFEPETELYPNGKTELPPERSWDQITRAADPVAGYFVENALRGRSAVDEPGRHRQSGSVVTEKFPVTRPEILDQFHESSSL
jgi:hypothetical protein